MNEVAKKGMPNPWRTARVLPLFKSGNKLDVSNYRPISNLASFSKLYEKMLLKRLNEETAGLEGSSQHGFRPNHSTVTACLELQSVISEALDDGKYAMVYSIDMSAAFDLLRRDILLHELRTRGNLSEGLLFLISDFLDGRKMKTEVDGKLSGEHELKVGCVQGSTLGPRLFTIYCGGLPTLIKADHYVTYADDIFHNDR